MVIVVGFLFAAQQGLLERKGVTCIVKVFLIRSRVTALCLKNRRRESRMCYNLQDMTVCCSLSFCESGSAFFY